MKSITSYKVWCRCPYSALLIRWSVLALFAVVFSGCIDTIDKVPVKAGVQKVYRINAVRCTGCGDCLASCPDKAIYEVELSTGFVVVIDPERCVGCGECVDKCRYMAIDKSDYHGAVQ